MLVRVEAVGAGADFHALGVGLADHFRTHLGVRLEVEVLAPESLPRYQLKTKRIFDSREPADRPQITLGGKA
jgi:phenylacetate-CoA ligase